MANRSEPFFVVGRRYRMILGFGWVELPRPEPPLVGDQGVSTQEVADLLNRMLQHGKA